MQPQRTCTQCGLAKPATEFHRRSAVKSGLKARCKPCENARGAAYRRDAGQRYAKRAAVRYWANPEAHRLAAQCHSAVKFAIRDGILTRPTTCEQCGSPGRIEAAHYDYVHPLVVRWLCHSCHVQWDRAEPKMPPGPPRPRKEPPPRKPRKLKTNVDDVREMRALYAAGAASQPALAARFGLALATVWAILHGRSWRHVI